MTLVIEHLVSNLREAASYNPESQAAPACILWPDHDRQWESLIPRLLEEIPELLVLGKYDPPQRRGPAIWLRCVLAGKIAEVPLPKDKTFILYLPGVGRADLRAVQTCKEELKPLAELQYRGVIWSQANAKDWTIYAFLKSEQGGLGLDVALDQETKNATQLAIYYLLDQEVAKLKKKKLNKDFLNSLYSGDPVQEVLKWLDEGEKFKKAKKKDSWQAFVEICQSQFALHPDNDGLLVGASKFAQHEGAWLPVWHRYCESPLLYPNIEKRIRKTQLPAGASPGGYPQWNEEQETLLRQALKELENLAPPNARTRIGELEKHHAPRRNLVWAALKQAPLAQVLEHLAVLAEVTAQNLTFGSIQQLADSYQHAGWQADDRVMRALSVEAEEENLQAIITAIRVLYQEWVQESAKCLQRMVSEIGYPNPSPEASPAPIYPEGECVLFVDGLRLDAAKRLTQLLEDEGYTVKPNTVWAALPTVTSTGKPAVSPVRAQIVGSETSTDFQPGLTQTGQSLKGGYHLKKLLTDADWQILEKSYNRTDKRNAWCEAGNIDHEGHEHGWELAKQLDKILKELKKKVTRIFEGGWKSVRIVTDHGWLLLPGGLPEVKLTSSLVDTKWGRCAAIKPSAVTKVRRFPWYWNANLFFALADGIACFRKEEYAHGGLSLQECLTQELIVSAGIKGRGSASVSFTDLEWKGLRCTVSVAGQIAGLSVDIRTDPGNPKKSIAAKVKLLQPNGAASIIVEDEDLEGKTATVVLIDSEGELVAQQTTKIGGDDHD